MAITLQQAAGHPLAWLGDHMTAPSWTTWIKPLALTSEAGAAVITAPSDFVRERVEHEYGPVIARRLGPVTWRVERREP